MPNTSPIFQSLSSDLWSALSLCLVLVVVHLLWLPCVHGQSFHEHTVASGASTVQAASGADVDGDGDTDVIAAVFGDDELVWYENRKGGSFVKHVISSSVDGPCCIHVVDLDEDDYPDIFVGTLHGNSIKLFENTGDGNFRSSTIDDSAGEPYSLNVATIDGDNHPDLVSAANGTNQVVWYQNQGDDTFGSAGVLSSDAKGARSVVAGDVDGNGRTDIVAAAADDSTVSWIKNDGSSFSEVIVNDENGGVGSVTAADVTGNGAIDIVSASLRSDEIVLYENTPVGADSVTFRNRILSSSAEGAESVIATDIGGEGEVDVVAASRLDNTVAIYQNDGRARFSERILTHSASGAIHVDTADIDDDGNLDILASSQGDDTVRWFETNLRPSARDTSVKVKENAKLRGTPPGVLSKDVDPDNDSLTARLVRAPPAGSLSAIDSNGEFVFGTNNAFDSLAQGESRTVSFEYQAMDEHGLADTASVHVTVRGVNDAPKARPNVDSTGMGARVVTDVLENDGDVDGELSPSSVSLSTLPSNGSVQSEGVDGIAYTPDAKFAGEDSYQYVVSDGQGGRDTARVEIKVRPPAPRITHAVGGDQSIGFKWSPNDSLDVKEYRVYRKSIYDRDRGQPDRTITNPDNREYSESDLKNGRIYEFLVTAVVSGPVEGAPDTVRVVPRVPEIDLKGTVSFGSHDQTTGYRMIGIPGSADDLVLASTLSGDAGEEWTAFAASGITESSGMVPIDENPEAFQFQTGRGFWLLNKNRWEPTGEVAPSSLDQKAMTAVPLPDGWSIVTNPFPKPVAWSRVKKATPKLQSELWAFAGTFSVANKLRPYQGYYVFNDPRTPVDTLHIPYPRQDTSQKVRNQRGARLTDKQWTSADARHQDAEQGLKIRARTVGEGNRSNQAEDVVRLLVGPGTAVGRDSVDEFAPPSVDEKSLRLTVRSPAASPVYPVLRTEGRPLGSDQVATFTLLLRGSYNGTVSISGGEFTGISGASVLLHDPATEKVTNLRKSDATVHLTHGSIDDQDGRVLELWIGDSRTLNKRKAATAASELALYPAAPNPTSSSTRFRYSIPESRAPVQTQIILYDVLGRTVRRLVSKRKGAGQHVVHWDGEGGAGESLASGVYFCRFIADGEPVETRKVIVVR